MKQPHRRNLILIILIFISSSLPLLATSIAVVIPVLQQAARVALQAVLSMALVAGHYLNVKPHFPSQAENQCFQILTDNSTQKILHDVSKETGIVISPEFITQLDAAGMHHDFAKLANLLAHVESIKGVPNSVQKILEKNQYELNPYVLVPGIKSFEKLAKYPGDFSANSSSYSNVTQNNIASYTVALPINKAQETNSKTVCKPAEAQHKEHNGEPLLTNAPHAYQAVNSLSKNQQRIIAQMQPYEVTGNSHASMNQLFHQGTLASVRTHGKAEFELQNAVFSVLPHLQNPDLRYELKCYLSNHQKTLKDACQIGVSPEIIKAQTKIAMQGLPLPGFLQEFSDVLQEKMAPLCFDKRGNWHGIEKAEDLEKLKQVIQAYDDMLTRLSIHFDFGNASTADRCVEQLYTMDQGRGSLLSRFFNWIKYCFDEDAISYQELRSRILNNSYNNQAFTALDLLEKNEFILARIPLEQMNGACPTRNGILLHQQLLNNYKQEVQSRYGTCKIPLIYQNDPVYSLYKPTLAQMQDSDEKIRLVEAHLSIRDSIYHEIINKIYRGQSVPPLVQHLAYGMIDKLNDPMALIDHLQHLSSDSENPEIRQAYEIFFDKGVLKLFDLKKQAIAYGITLPDSISLQKNTSLRTAANKLLLVDAQTEEGKQSLGLALQYIPYACNADEYAQDYEKIISAITQAHTKNGSPTQAITLKALAHPSRATNKEIAEKLVHAAGKAAIHDLAQQTSDDLATSPLTTPQAWACIRKIQDLEEQGDIIQAKALANTYLQGYIEGQMPENKFMRRALAATALTASAGSIWWAASSDNQKQLPRIVPQGPPQKCNLPDNDDEQEDKDRNKENTDKKLNEFLQKARLEKKTSSKTEIYEKLGNYDDASRDFDKFNPENIRDIPGKGKVGYLPDGKTINVRNASKDKRPTLEIYNPKTERSIKIRYGSKLKGII